MAIVELKEHDIDFLIDILDDVPPSDIRKPIADIIKKKLIKATEKYE